jgi:DNA-binding CsgD family transcriptional regulator
VIAVACARCGRANRETAVFCDACGASLGTPVHDPFHAPQQALGPGEIFVGRERELATLGAAVEHALAGRGRILALSGEPGIGKTRTAQVLARYAGTRDLRVLWGRCHEEPGAPPYWPWLQILRAYLEPQDDAVLAALLEGAAAHVVEIVPELALRRPDLASVPRSADPVQGRYRLFDAIAGFWKRVAAREPLALILDNLHWADAPSLRLLEFLAPEIAASRLLVLATYRDIELTRAHPLSGTLGELAKQPSFQRLKLGGLSLAETGRFVAAATGQTPPAELLATVHGQTEGNPLFVAEMVRFLVQEGMLGPDARPDARAAAHSALNRIPEGIKEAIGTRLNRLSSTCNAVLRDAAVIGRRFSARVLERMSDDPGEDARSAALEESAAAAVIEAQPDAGAYQFSHALIRETLYDEIPATRRSRLHLRIAEVLEALHRDEPDAILSSIAHHYCAALPGGDAAKAVEYARRAAEHADRLFAYEEAARYYRLALQALEGTGESRQRLQLLIALGNAQTKAGENSEAAELLQQAARSARSLGLAEEFARAACAFEEARWRPGLPGNAAVGLLLEAQAGLGEGDSRLKAEVLSSLTRALIFSGEVKQATAVHETAVAMARRLGDTAALYTALISMLSARWRPERFAERMETTLEALRLAQEAGDRERALDAWSWRLFDLMELGDVGLRATEFDAYVRLADEVGQPFFQYVGVSSRAMLALFHGQFDESERHAKAALEFGKRMPSLDAVGVYGVQMFSLRREQGRLAELAPLVEHFVRATPAAATWRPGLAVIYAELERKDAARAEFEALAADDFEGLERDARWLMCIAYLADVCAFLRDAARAGTLYRLLTPFDGHNIVVGPNIACYGAAARHLGMLAGVMERWTDSERHFEAALEMNGRQAARPWLAHTQHQFAAMLLARGRGEDRARAAGLLDEAFAAGQALGMRALAERAAALREQPLPPAGKDAYPAGLSRREVEVLRLVAAGKGNREIAARLFVSPNTVANHVRSILTKTNTANRTEAAAFAVRQALFDK